jgi:hypothetical protein
MSHSRLQTYVTWQIYKVNLCLCIILHDIVLLLASAVLGDLSIALRRNGKQVYREFVHLLLVSNLRRVDLSVFSPEGLSDILPLVARKCPVSINSKFIIINDVNLFYNSFSFISHSIVVRI